MIFLKKLNIIFFKPKKTAGTSVEIAFSCNADNDDIITPIMPHDERVRHEIGGLFPRNWAWRKNSELNYQKQFDQFLQHGAIESKTFGKKQRRLYKRSDAKFINHIAPEKCARRLGYGAVDNAFRITMCRHPYETVVSLAYHLSADNNEDFNRVLDKISRKRAINEEYIFSRLQPSYIIRYEHLEEDLIEIEKKHGLRLLEYLPITKGSARTDRRKASEILNCVQKARIQKSYKQTFEAFDYRI